MWEVVLLLPDAYFQSSYFQWTNSPVTWGWSDDRAEKWALIVRVCVFVYVCVCVNPRRKETDLLPQCSSSSSSIIPALHASVMLTLKELKRSQQARAHLLQVTLISWWAEHPVSLPINASMRYNSVGLGGGRWVVKLTCGPPVKYKPQRSE